MKQCTTCRISKPATKEFFVTQSASKHGITSQCKQCQKNAMKKWREANREKLRAYDAARYRCNPEKEKDRKKAWRKSNPEKQWHKLNPDMASESARMWRMKNKDRYRDNQKIWQKENPEKVKHFKRKVHEKNSSLLTDTYVRHLLKLQLKIKTIPNEIINAKRKQLKLYRYAKQNNDSSRA